jgi:outer membrane biosynthesis protein TonB
MKTFILPLLTLALPVVAADPQPLSPNELRARAGRPIVIVAPEYPKAAAAEKLEATVDVFGLVRADGSFQLNRIEAQPEREEFKAAVRSVIEYWAMLPAYGADCRPMSAESQLRLWFEIKEGRGPVVSVSRPRLPDSPPTPEGAKSKLKVVKRVEPMYPYAAIRANVQGTIEAYMLIQPDGSVNEISTAPTRLPAQFAASVKDALSRWTFEPRPGEPAVCAFYEVVFRIRD